MSASSSFLTGEVGRLAGAVVMMAMSSSASCEIKGWTSAGSGGPRQEARLTVTLPCMPSARARSQIRSWFGHPLLRSGIMKCPGNAFGVYRSDHASLPPSLITTGIAGSRRCRSSANCFNCSSPG